MNNKIAITGKDSMTLEEAYPHLRRLVSYFIKTHIGYLYLFDSVEDMHSELILRCVKRYPSFDPQRGMLSTYVSVVCTSWCNHVYQVYKRHGGFEQSVASLDEYVNPEETATYVDTVAVPIKDIDKEAEDREVISVLNTHMSDSLRRYLNGVSMTDQAKEEGVTRAEMSRRIAKERRLLRRIEAQVRDGTYGKFTTKTKLAHRIMPLLDVSERTAYRKINRYLTTGRCEECLKHVFNDKEIIQ